jgi:cyclophilin family peptidyl-prolyl cis-trans isomerase
MIYPIPRPLLSLLLAVLLPGAFAFQASATVVRFQTSLGDIDVQLYDAATPISVDNFLSYVTSNRYDGTFIHRVPQLPGGGSADFVVQGGGYLLNNSIFAATAVVADPPIGAEPLFSNTRGTLAVAKHALGATSQWFFNVADNSFLDSQDFTVFGRVLGDGLSVVDAINDLPTINATVAQNAPGEDFDEIPVRDLHQVIAQQDITANEAVMVTDVSIIVPEPSTAVLLIAAATMIPRRRRWKP